jgi:hypothetical protein
MTRRINVTSDILSTRWHFRFASDFRSIAVLQQTTFRAYYAAALRLFGLGQLAQLNSESLCARSGHRPWFAGIPTASGGA